MKRKTSLKLNVVANYTGKLLSIVSIYIFVPIYIQILGIDAYGLIAFNAVVLAFLSIADSGLSAAFAREAAKRQERQDLLDVLVTVERVLFVILVVIGIAFEALAPILADHWLGSDNGISRNVVIETLRIMPLALISQIGISLYFGGLMGLERQVVANFMQIIYILMRSGFVIIPIYVFPDIRLFFAWQVIISITMLLIMRATLIRYIRGGNTHASIRLPVLRGRFSKQTLQGIQGYALGMFGMSIVAGLNTQFDKLVVSKMLPLVEFAQYSLVSNLALIPYILTLPIATALLPRFTKVLEANRNKELTSLYRSSTYYIASLGAIAGVALCLFNAEILALWLPDVLFDDLTLSAAKLLALGSILLTFQLAPFQLSLAHGHNATNLRLGASMLMLSVPLQVFLTAHYGIMGAAIPWLVVNLVAFFYLGVFLNLKFPFVSLATYFLVDTLPAVLVAVIFLGSARLIANAMYVDSLASCGVAAFASITALVFSRSLRQKISL